MENYILVIILESEKERLNVFIHVVKFIHQAIFPLINGQVFLLTYFNDHLYTKYFTL